MLKELFENDYALYFNSLPKNKEGNITTVAIRSETISASSFDLMDKKSTIQQPVGEGCVTYHNTSGLPVVVIDYEKLMDDLGQLTHGIKRCDFVCYQGDGGMLFFIANELSTGNAESKWPKAWKQFASTLKHLKAVDSVWQLITAFKFRYCIVSYRPQRATSPNDMAKPFFIPYSLVKAAQEIKCKPINQYGFKVFEATQVNISSDDIQLCQ